MKLIVQPDAGIAPIVTAIKQAKKSIDILIFRLDRYEIDARARGRGGPGCHVRALTAHTNRGGDKSLRKLEMRLLGRRRHRVAHRRRPRPLSRQDDDRRQQGPARLRLQLHGPRHREEPQLRRHQEEPEAGAGSRSSCSRPTSTGSPTRPARTVSSSAPTTRASGSRAFIKGARKQLLIYDPQVTDDAMLRLITERIKAGVDVKIIGKVEAKWNITSEKYPGKRLHIRAIIRDGKRAFLGSQSLRRLELEKRREVGVIVTDQARHQADARRCSRRTGRRPPSGKKEAEEGAKSRARSRRSAEASRS